VANHASSEKRNRQTVKRTERNRALRSEFRTLVKSARSSIEKDARANPDAALKAFRAAAAALDGAVTAGVLHRATASRKVSRLASALHKHTHPKT
jgi:small subunit ribosomal protein S20